MNPWAERFMELQSHDEIRRRSQSIPPPLPGLNKLEIETACKKLESAFKSLFIPTEQTVSIMADLLGLALAHSASTYISKKEFMAGLYAASCPLPEMFFPICLTGLAGVGKTQVLTAARRMISDPMEVKADPGHSPFPLRPAWHLSVRDRMTVSGILLHLLGEENAEKYDDLEESTSATSRARHTNRKDISLLLRRCRRIAYKSGISLLIADEFQFATRSENANALVVSMLLHLSALGLPMLFAANFSLGYKLMRRPQEDIQRLLGRPLVLVPDLASSDDWLATLRAYQAVAPDVFVFDPVMDGKTIHGWTAGLKRLLANILVIAYRRARRAGRVVNVYEIESAFKSVDYSTNRNDVNLINQQNVTGKMARKDLWCPFEMPKADTAALHEEAQSQRLAQTGIEMVKSAMTRNERQAYSTIEKAARNGSRTAKATVSSLKNEKESRLEALRKGEAIFRANRD